MATGLVTNFDLLMGLPNFQRDVVETYEELISVDREGEYAQGHIVYCKETDSYYSYTEVYSQEMGFFKPLSLGGGIDFVEIESDIEYSDLDFVDTESDLVPEEPEPEPEPEPNPEDPNNPEGGEDGGGGTEDGGEDTGGNDGNGENNGEDNGEVEEPTEPTEPIT